MARINIEDSLFLDPRFDKLCFKLGSRALAIGELVIAWQQAQKSFKEGSKFIPSTTWIKLGLCMEILGCGLAEETDAGIKMCGAEEQFQWLQRRQADGRAGGQKRAKNSKRDPSGRWILSRPLTPTLPLPLTPTLPPAPTVLNPSKEIWDTYLKSYLRRYGVEPVRNAKTNSNIKSLVTRLGKEDAKSVVEFFLSHNDGFYLKRTHDIGLCLKDAESLRTQMLRNKPVTTSDIRAFEKQDYYSSQIERLTGGQK